MGCCGQLDIKYYNQTIDTVNLKITLNNIYNENMPLYQKIIFVAQENIFATYPNIIIPAIYIEEDLKDWIYIKYFLYSQFSNENYKHIVKVNESMIKLNRNFDNTICTISNIETINYLKKINLNNDIIKMLYYDFSFPFYIYNNLSKECFDKYNEYNLLLNN